jgi:hypothetical protein
VLVSVSFCLTSFSPPHADCKETLVWSFAVIVVAGVRPAFEPSACRTQTLKPERCYALLPRGRHSCRTGYSGRP